MPMIDADGCPIHVEVEGPDDAPVLMLSNSLGTTLHMWDRAGRQPSPRLPPGALRPARPWQVGRAERPLHHGASRPRRARGAGRARYQEDAIGAGCRWAAWSGKWLGANAPRAHRPARSCRTRRAIIADKNAWNDRIKLVREKGLRAPSSAPTWSAGSPRTFASARRRPIARMQRMFARDAARRLYRLLRGDARHGPPRAAAEDQGADAGHRRPARPGDHGRGRRIHPRVAFPGAKLAGARRRAYLQCRAAGGLYRRRCSDS